MCCCVAFLFFPNDSLISNVLMGRATKSESLAKWSVLPGGVQTWGGGGERKGYEEWERGEGRGYEERERWKGRRGERGTPGRREEG